MSDTEQTRLEEESVNRERVRQAKVLLNHPGFVKGLEDEELYGLIQSVGVESLTRDQQEHVILYMLKLMVEEDANAAADTEYAAEASPVGRRQDQSSVEAAVATPVKKGSKKRAADSDGDPCQEVSPPPPHKKPATPRRKPTNVAKPDGQVRDPLPQLEWLLFVPENTRKRGAWKAFNELPDNVQDELKNMFNSDYCTSERAPKYRAWFNKVVKNSGGNDRLRCVNNMTYIYGSYLPKYSSEPGTMDRACDSCVKTNRVCAKLVKMRGKDKLGIFPLPSGIRKTAKWDELGFWVSQ